MPRYWTCHWQNRSWHPDINHPYEPIDCSASNSFRKRGVSIGDVAYIVSLADGQLMLGGRMTIEGIVSHKEARTLLNYDGIYEANEVIVAAENPGTPLHLHRRLAPALARRLRLVSPNSEPKGLAFTSKTRLDNQATRGIRELTSESAALLDRIIEVTDRLPRSRRMLTITEAMIDNAPAFPSGFNPSIDRYDPRSVSRLFRWLWPDPSVALAHARELADSIQVAHEAADACWSVTMKSDTLQLNVGPVEVMTLTAVEARFLVHAPLDQAHVDPGEVEIDDDPEYAAVPVPSGACYFAAADLTRRPPVVRQCHDTYIRAAASRRRVSIFKGWSPAVIDYLESVLMTALPRPSHLAPAIARHQLVIPLPDEVDEPTPLAEGARYQITVNAYERNPENRRQCIERHGTVCCICKFDFGAAYGEMFSGMIHVHHLRPLAEVGEEHSVDPEADLRPVCPNCHAVLHRRVPAYSIEEVQRFLGGRLVRAVHVQ
jgi:hypothetical protein